MNVAFRRGACPGLSAPMQTGDGLLVRLQPIGTIPFAAFKNLCAAARRHGNGIVEVTARGSIQVRGLSQNSAPRFTDAVATLGIAAEDGVPVISNALAGLDPAELIDAGTLAADLRHALGQTPLPSRLSPKVSVAIDGGGALDLGTLSADVRLRAELIKGTVRLRVSVGGDGASATPLGTIMSSDCTDTALRLLDVIAQRGRDARARDVIAAGEIASFNAVLASCPSFGSAKTKDQDGRDKPGHDGDPIGQHRLRDSSFACGIGLAFGHADASTLERLADAAEAAEAAGLRTAPNRALIAIGLTETTAFANAAERLGFIVRAGDPRRHVVACAGAPICASAHIAARAMAPSIAEIAAPYLRDAFNIHISGCAKGCAHAAAAALTVVGTAAGCALIANGLARDDPSAVVPAEQLPTAIMEAVREVSHV
jgi:precorrin-3B synthase